MIDRRLFTHIDWLTMLVTALLALTGFLTVYSATFSKWPSIYTREFYWILIGALALASAVAVNYSVLERFAYVIYGASITLLLGVFVVGKTMSGARRWIGLGLFNIQPSEFAKLALIIALAKYFSSRSGPAKGMGIKELAPPFFLLALPFILVAKQPDLGTAIIIWMIFWTMAFTVKVRFRLIALGAVIAGALMPFVWKMLKGYQKARLTSFLDPSLDPQGSGYHLMQSKIAIGSGGFFGKGFMESTQGKLMFLPEHHTDFIFAVLAEEWGLIGTMFVLGLFITLIMSGLNAASNAKDRFGFLLAYGVTAMLFWHAAINLFMVTGMLPVVGVPLPFISYGGSFLLTCMIGAGLLINVKMRSFMF